MAYIILLILGGMIGWGLLAYAIIIGTRCRRKELGMIKEISIELKKVRAELNELK